MASRASEVYDVRGAQIYLEDCVIAGFHSPNSHRGGAAVALAGCGAEWVWARHCTFYGRQGDWANTTPPKDQLWMRSMVSSLPS